MFGARVCLLVTPKVYQVPNQCTPLQERRAAHSQDSRHLVAKLKGCEAERRVSVVSRERHAALDHLRRHPGRGGQDLGQKSHFPVGLPRGLRSLLDGNLHAEVCYVEVGVRDERDHVTCKALNKPRRLCEPRISIARRTEDLHDGLMGHAAAVPGKRRKQDPWASRHLCNQKFFGVGAPQDGPPWKSVPEHHILCTSYAEPTA